MSKRKPDTAGCTEWSCPYHGGDNRFKAAHLEGCPVRESSQPVWAIVDDVEAGDLSKACNCWPEDEGVDNPEPPGYDEQYDRENPFDIGGEG